MARIVAFADKKGKLYPTPEAAAISNLVDILGGSAESMAQGFANTIFKNRAELEAVFREYDGDVASVSPVEKP